MEGQEEKLTGDRIPIDALAQLEYEKSILFFGVVPLVFIGLVLICYVALYYYRRTKQWNELGEAMRLDDLPDESEAAGVTSEVKDEKTGSD